MANTCKPCWVKVAMLNKSGESGCTYLIPDLKEKQGILIVHVLYSDKN